MLAEVLRTYYGYNAWAMERVLDCASRLTPEQLLAPGDGGQRSVRDTLVHLVGVQRSWLSWWDGSLSGAEAYALSLDPADFPDVATLRTAWEEVERRTQAFVATLTDADTTRQFEHTLPNGSTLRIALWQMMLHVANHGTQHRSEVAAQLTRFGQSPGNLDLLFYFMQRS